MRVLRRDGTRARINVQLIKAAAGVQTWAENYKRDMGDAFQAAFSEIPKYFVTRRKIFRRNGKRNHL